MSISIAIAVEDSLSEIVLRRLIDHSRRDMTVAVRYPLTSLPGGHLNPKNRNANRGYSGYGQLKVNLPAFNAVSSTGTPFIVLTDLDVHVKCPGELLGKWLGKITPSPNLIFRVAVKEVEAWLLADTSNIAHYLAIDEKNVVPDTEGLPDPKMEVVTLAKLSSSQEIIENMVPQAGSTAKLGRCFDRMLSNFTQYQWNIDDAAKNSPSLRRAINALKQFKPT